MSNADAAGAAGVPTLREWIAGENAAVLTGFEQSVGAHVPYEFWRDPAGPGGASIAWLTYHGTLHADLAINAVVRGGPTVISRARHRLGCGGFPISFGLGEAEVPELAEALDLDALGDYVEATHTGIQSWIESAPETVFAAPVDAAAGLRRAGIDEADVPWLFRMWVGQPASFFLQWEAIGHRLSHIGEMVSVRNRLGLSPF